MENIWGDKDRQQEEERKKTKKMKKMKKGQQKSHDNNAGTTLNHVLISGSLPNYMTCVSSFEEEVATYPISPAS